MSRGEEAPIRIMRIITRMNIGGPAVQITGLMRGINQSEFDHRLYTGYCESDEEDYLNSVGTTIKAVRLSGLGRRISLVSDFSAFLSLVKAIREFKPHIIHTHTAKAGFLGRVASILSCQKSIRVHTFHGHLLFGYFGFFKRRIVISIEKLLSFKTHKLLAVGEQIRQDLLTIGIGRKETFGLMPPGLTLAKLPTRVEARGRFGLSNDNIYCAFIGRLAPIKRLDRFFDVVREIQKRQINLAFLVAGGGELLEYCQKRISTENLPVTILGWQKNIEDVLSASDMVLLTSDSEGTPLSLIQAGMAQLPVVSTNVGSISEIVLHKKTGIISTLDVSNIADALEQLTVSDELRYNLGTAAKHFTLTNFGVEKLVRRHEELYRNLISSQAKF